MPVEPPEIPTTMGHYYAETFEALDAGDYYACGILRGGQLACEGRTFYFGWAERVVSSKAHYAGVASGATHVCALRMNRRAECWAAEGAPAEALDAAEPPDDEFVQLAAGQTHTCGVRKDGGITCWGENDHGQCDVPVLG